MEERRTIPTIAGNYSHYYARLYDALTGKGENPVSAKDGIRVMQILEAARTSSRERKAITVKDKL